METCSPIYLLFTDVFIPTNNAELLLFDKMLSPFAQGSLPSTKHDQQLTQ